MKLGNVKSLRKYSIPTLLSMGWLVIIALTAVLYPLISSVDPKAIYENDLAVGPFTNGHFFGTDTNGYDIFQELLHGTRLTLLVAVIAVGVGGTIGSLIGIFSGYVRGKIDAVVNVVFSAILSIPNLVLALGLVAVLATAPDVNSTVSSWKQVFVVILSLTIVIIPILGRIARGATLSWSNREFVTAAKSMGAKNSTILWKHIVPNVLPAVMAIAFLAVGVVIVAEGSLSLLGVGIPDGNSWGAILAAGRNDMEYTPHVIYFPIICIALTVISCNQIGDVIRQSLDKREARI
jgi:peptide/nickel transport system permease protein